MNRREALAVMAAGVAAPVVTGPEPAKGGITMDCGPRGDPGDIIASIPELMRQDFITEWRIHNYCDLPLPSPEAT